jgi:molybdopterin/thiamine biosynthesis adenylyltransferase
MWYMTDLGRLSSERVALTELETQQPWFSVVRMYLDDQIRLCFDAEIEIGPKRYPIRLTYPQTFPHTPVSVLPQFPERWSEHQWGRGELCLEWGPDNWVPGISGAQMVESAYRLLRDETPSGTGDRPVIPSRHVESLGQQLRASGVGFVLTRALVAELERAQTSQVLPMGFLMRSPKRIVIPLTIGDDTGAQWRDPTIPDALKVSSIALKGFVAILPADTPVPDARTASAFKSALADAGCVYPEGYISDVLDMCLVWAGGSARLFWVKDGPDTVTEFKCTPEGKGGRLEPSRAALAACTVGLVGCGSAGAKIATSLARTGVGNFLLIDDDVMLPENLVRQDLDWDAVGDHKAEGLKRRIEMIAPAAKCTVRRQQLAGQESSGSIDGALTVLQTCDLIIDATANPRVFNLLGAVVAAAKKPLLWLEIFGGGFGGMIARSRPGRDPAPQIARAQIEAWCAEKNVAAPRATGGYEIDAPEGPMVADDADVAVMAAHATRFAIDILASPENSAFPVSAYLVGLTQTWLFQQPFHTFPIDLGEPEPAADEAIDPNGLATLQRLISERHDRNAAA